MANSKKKQERLSVVETGDGKVKTTVAGAGSGRGGGVCVPAFRFAVSATSYAPTDWPVSARGLYSGTFLTGYTVLFLRYVALLPRPIWDWAQ